MVTARDFQGVMAMMITITGSFGECYNLHWGEYKTKLEL
jgi:hypothetical protein